MSLIVKATTHIDRNSGLSERSTDWGNFLPDDTNTGVPDLSVLTAFNDPNTATVNLLTPNSVIEDKIVYGRILNKTTGVRFRRCLFRGGNTWPAGDTACIDCNSASGNDLEVWDSTYAPQLPNYYADFMIGRGYKSYRNRVIWANDAFGVYTAPALGSQSTDVGIFGNYVTDSVYWHGNTAQYAGQATGSITVSTTWGTNFVVPTYPIKPDGTHNDGVQIQGAYGGSHSVHVKGNRFQHYDADQTKPHPLGWAGPLPMLGTQDGHKRRVYNQTGPNPLPDGKWAPNGQSIIVQQNVNKFPAADTVVVEENWLDDYGQGITLMALAGSWTTMAAVVRNNRVGGNGYNFASSGAARTYPVRCDNRAGLQIDGLDTNVWWGGAPYGVDGQVITEGRTGLQYDS